MPSTTSPGEGKGGAEGGGSSSALLSETTTFNFWPFGTLVIRHKKRGKNGKDEGGEEGEGRGGVSAASEDPVAIEAEIKRLQAALLASSRTEKTEKEGGEEKGRASA